MINEENFTVQCKVYIRGNKLYRILSYCPEPSITMVSLEGNIKANFGIGGTMAKEFEEVPNVIYNHERSSLEVIKDGKLR